MAKAKNNQPINFEEENTSKSKVDKTKGMGKTLPNVREFNKAKEHNQESYLLKTVKEIYSRKSKQFYVIFETEEFSAISHRGNVKSKHLFDNLLPKLENETAMTLTMTCNSSAKDGFDLGYDETKSLYVQTTQNIEIEGESVSLITYELEDPDKMPKDTEKEEEEALGKLTADFLLGNSTTK